ncbi:MAG: aspartate/glutamate racemase family protein [Hydrogenophaga sp.]|jgi:Asp/Glu/hydantoin racemase|nr:aspartate/glutamate racemase family protein [Hydrogenophaga sp.]
MGKLLILNPNTSDGVTQRLVAHAQAQAPAGWVVQGAQARFGARYISGEMAAAVAAHAALDAFAQHAALQGEPDAVLLGCFGDPGLFALRACTAAPVFGLAEAAMRAASAHGRYAIVTGGAAWVPMLERLARALQIDAALCGVQTVPRSGGELAADPVAAHAVLLQAGRQALARWPEAQALLLGGAGLAGMAAPLAGALPVPVLDNVSLALDAIWALPRRPPVPVAKGAEPGPWIGLDPFLERRLSGAAFPGKPA